MNNKAIFLDIDGTLVSSSQKISQLVKNAIKTARKNGHFVFLCTGRNKVRAQKLDDIITDGIICSNGGYIQIKDKMIYDASFEKTDIHYICSLFDANEVEYILRGNEKSFSSNNVNEFIRKILNLTNSEFDNIKNESEQMDTVYSISKYNEFIIPVKTIFFLCYTKDYNFVECELNKKYTVIHHFSHNGYTMAELNLKSVSKGYGILKVIQSLNINQKDTICFGDGMNDIEMMQTCHISVAMDNACEELKKVATNVCETVDEDGVFHELKRLNLI